MNRESKFDTLNWVYGIPRNVFELMGEEAIDEWINYHLSLPHSERYTPREKAFLGEQFEIECLLAEALGYLHDEEYGWVIGDHTPVTLAMEVLRKMKGINYVD